MQRKHMVKGVQTSETKISAVLIFYWENPASVYFIWLQLCLLDICSTSVPPRSQHFFCTLYSASLIFLDYWTSFNVVDKNQWLCMCLQLVNYCLNVFVFLQVCNIVHTPVIVKTLWKQLLSLSILRSNQGWLCPCYSGNPNKQVSTPC